MIVHNTGHISTQNKTPARENNKYSKILKPKSSRIPNNLIVK